MNLRTGAWFYQLAAHKRSADFIVFLTQLLTAYPAGRVYVLVDNASIHTSQAVQRWLAAHGRLVLVYLPTYSGHRLNPVENVWWALNLTELDAAIREYFADFSPASALALVNCSVVRQALAAVPQVA